MQRFTMHLGKRTKTIDIPTRWEHVTFRQLLKLQETPPDDWGAILAIFLEEDKDEVMRATCELGSMDDVLVCISFLRAPMPVSPLPKAILGYVVPGDLGFKTMAQYQYFQDDAKAHKDSTPVEQLARYATYCAVYAQPLTHPEGLFVVDDAEAMAEVFMNAPATEVLAVGNFTVLKLIGLSQPIKDAYQRRLSLPKRLLRAFRAWRMLMVSTVRVWLWKRNWGSEPKS